MVRRAVEIGTDRWVVRNWAKQRMMEATLLLSKDLERRKKKKERKKQTQGRKRSDCGGKKRRTLLSNVVAMRAIGIGVGALKELTQYRVVPMMHNIAR